MAPEGIITWGCWDSPDKWFFANSTILSLTYPTGSVGEYANVNWFLRSWNGTNRYDTWIAFSSVTNPDWTEVTQTLNWMLQYLKHMTHALEVLETRDAQNRQQVVVTNAPQTIAAYYTAGNTVNFAAQSWVGMNPSIQYPSTLYRQPVMAWPVDQRRQIIDAANAAYNTWFRANLSFT